MSKNVSYIKDGSLSKFQLPWITTYTGITTPDYTQGKLLELLRAANPEVKIKKLRLNSDKKGIFMEVKYKGDGLEIPESLKACFE